MVVKIDAAEAGTLSPVTEFFRDESEYNSFIGVVQLEDTVLNGFQGYIYKFVIANYEFTDAI